MKVRIILCNSAGELDRQTIEINESANNEIANNEISCEIIQALKCWTLAPGDSIEILEVD